MMTPNQVVAPTTGKQIGIAPISFMFGKARTIVNKIMRWSGQASETGCGDFLLS